MVLQDGLGAIAGQGGVNTNLGQQEAIETTGGEQSTQEQEATDVKDTDVLKTDEANAGEETKTLNETIYNEEVKPTKTDERISELDALADEILGGDGNPKPNDNSPEEEGEGTIESKEEAKENVQEKIEEAEGEKDEKSVIRKMKEAMETLALEYHGEKTELIIANKKKDREIAAMNKALEAAQEQLEQYKMNPRFIEADDKTAAFDITWKAFTKDRDNKRVRDNLARMGMSIISAVYPEFDTVTAIQKARTQESAALTGFNNNGSNPQGIVKAKTKPKYQMGFPSKGR